jgi:predicted ATP-grasp superfamily ATP-dependent carboligase
MIVLAGFSVRALAESTVKAKKDCIAVDFFGDLDVVRTCKTVSLRREYGVSLDFNPFLFLKAVDGLQYDYLMYVGPLENHPQVLEEFSKKCVIIGNDAAIVKKVRDWRNVYQFCKSNDVLFPETVDGLEYVVKPKKSGGGIGIQRLSKYVVQKFVKGVNISASFLGDGNKGEVVSVNEQLIGKKEFGAQKFWYCGNITPVYVDVEDEIQSICDKAVKVFGLKGSCGIDFVVNDRVYLMEINPRIQATLELVERVFDVNMIVLHENAFKGIIEKGKSPKKTWGKAILYADRNVVMPDTTEWLDYKWIKDIPHPFEHIHKSEPLCTVIAEGSDRNDCFEHLVTRAASVKEFM